MLTVAELKQELDYDQFTGVFRWRISRYRGIKARQIKGEVAGHLQSKGYLALRISGVKHLVHRLAFLYMTGEWPVGQVDHVDRDKINNAWINLRDVDGTTNLGNSRPLWAHNTSGIKGVCFYKRDKTWQAFIRYKGKMIYLGRYHDIVEAAAARQMAEEKYFGN
jgi:hypothetical protein